MRVLVVATVHHPLDARVWAREIAALLAAGHTVTYAAPFVAFGVAPPPDVAAIDLPRSQGRRRVSALRAARQVMRSEAPRHDVVLVHSPELVLAGWGIDHPAMVWDVHEDTRAALGMKPWLPASLRPVAARGVEVAEGGAERRWRLMLAEDAYAHRFRERHPVVPNTPVVPERVPASQRGRVVYLGDLTVARGVEDLVETARLLAPDIAVDVIGTARGSAVDLLRNAQAAGWLRWHGFLPNDVALRTLEGACAGLSLLRDEPNYRHSMPTKLGEYLAHGVPFVSTPLPLAVRLAEQSGAGVIVPFADPSAAARAVRALDREDERRTEMASAGHRWMQENANWSIDGQRFVEQLEDWARG